MLNTHCSLKWIPITWFWLNVCHSRFWSWSPQEGLRLSSLAAGVIWYNLLCKGTGPQKTLLVAFPRDVFVNNSLLWSKREQWGICLKKFCLILPLCCVSSPKKEISWTQESGQPQNRSTSIRFLCASSLVQTKMIMGKVYLFLLIFLLIAKSLRGSVQWVPFLQDVLREQRWNWTVPLMPSCPLAETVHIQPTASAVWRKTVTLQHGTLGKNHPRWRT